MLRKLFRSKKIRFVVVGGINTLWGLAAYPILYALLTPFEVNYVVILILSYVAGTSFSFTTQKYLVFKSHGNHVVEISKFLAFQGAVMLINIVLLPLLVVATSINPVIVQIGIGIVFAGLSFFFHERITFRNSDES